MALTPLNTLLFVQRERFKIVLYERSIVSWKFRPSKTYGIAIGTKGYQTPQGVYLINTKAKNPEWRMPHSDWVPEELQGTVVPGGDPANPIRERWLGITDPEDGVGIHGTNAIYSIGTAASHGCLRMLPDDVIDLYGRVPKYTPIVIV